MLYKKVFGKLHLKLYLNENGKAEHKNLIRDSKMSCMRFDCCCDFLFSQATTPQQKLEIYVQNVEFYFFFKFSEF